MILTICLLGRLAIRDSGFEALILIPVVTKHCLKAGKVRNTSFASLPLIIKFVNETLLVNTQPDFLMVLT